MCEYPRFMPWEIELRTAIALATVECCVMEPVELILARKEEA